MTTRNRAAWLLKKHDATLCVDDAPYNKPEAEEVVIKTKAIAMNPADVAIQKVGIIIDTYPAILGCDIAGEVTEIGSGITDFKIGDRVIGQAQPFPGGIYKYAAFQEYVVLKSPEIAKIPDQISWTDAAVLPLGLNTAASCLFQEATLALEMPPCKKKEDEVLLIWGASSSVGSCGVQLATRAGYEVFGIASRKNHDFVKSIGATQTFDQADGDVIENVVAALKGKTCVGAYDAISKEKTLDTICKVLHKSGGRKLIAAVMPGVESLASHGVTIKTNLTTRNSETPVGHQIWRVYLEPALASGAIQCRPAADVVGHGLEAIQHALDSLAPGVSAKKIVVSL
ncbi:hypothetical protein MMC09_006435 [Bachmanniomyces sp. S44760]|nr:hypothetical protein [Bachmanniomyces sp. S44760]